MGGLETCTASLAIAVRLIPGVFDRSRSGDAVSAKKSDKPDGDGERVRTPREDLRDALASALSETQLKALIDEVLAIRKLTWASCTNCRKRCQVEIPDAKAVAGALKDLLAEGFGRPRSEDEGGERIVFQRLVDFPKEGE